MQVQDGYDVASGWGGGMSGKLYSVKEVFYTLQGEGINAGRPAVFIRFAGCNLWSGTEAGRASGKGGCAQWCDTDFVGTDGVNGGRYPADALAHAAWEVAMREQRRTPAWDEYAPALLAVLTGGEPTLQVDAPLVRALHKRDFRVAIETNGTGIVPDEVDWVCVSPKAGALNLWRRTYGNELKLVYGQPGLAPYVIEEAVFADQIRFDHYLLSPLWVPDADQWQHNKECTAQYVKKNPLWRLSLQTHKEVALP